MCALYYMTFVMPSDIDTDIIRSPSQSRESSAHDSNIGVFANTSLTPTSIHMFNSFSTSMDAIVGRVLRFQHIRCWIDLDKFIYFLILFGKSDEAEPHI